MPQKRGRERALFILDAILDDDAFAADLEVKLKDLGREAPGFFMSRLVIPTLPKEVLISGNPDRPIHMVISQVGPAKGKPNEGSGAS